MKLIFDDKSFIEITKSDDKIYISIQAKDYNDSSKKITNSVELNEDQFKQLISEFASA